MIIFFKIFYKNPFNLSIPIFLAQFLKFSIDLSGLFLYNTRVNREGQGVSMRFYKKTVY